MNWFLNLLDRNVIEREIKREKVQVKPPLVMVKLLDGLFKNGHGGTSITNNQVIAFKLSRAYMSLGDINFVLHKKDSSVA